MRGGLLSDRTEGNLGTEELAGQELFQEVPELGGVLGAEQTILPPSEENSELGEAARQEQRLQKFRGGCVWRCAHS